MKLLHKFHVHIDQKKYNLRIYEQREQNVYMMTIGDYAILMCETTQIDKIEDGFYAIEYDENKFIEVKLPNKPEVLFHFETLIRSKTDYARNWFWYQAVSFSLVKTLYIKNLTIN